MTIQTEKKISEYLIFTQPITNYCLIVKEVYTGLSSVCLVSLPTELQEYLKEFYNCNKLEIKEVSKTIKNIETILEMADIAYSDNTTITYCL